MNKTEFNREYIIRYYPDSGDRGKSKLIEATEMLTIVNNLTVFANIKSSVEKFKGDQLTIKLRRGISFDFNYR